MVTTVIRGTGPSDAASETGIFEAALGAARLFLELSPLERAEMTGATDRDLADRLRDCAGDVECASICLRRAGVRYGLLVIVNLGQDPVGVITQLVDARRGKAVGHAVEDVGAEERVSEVVRRQTIEVLRTTGARLGARVTVETVPFGAAVALSPAGPQRPLAPGDYLLPPGPYHVVATMEGHRSAEVDVELRPGEVRTVALRLEEASPGLFSSPWFWGVAGALVLAGGAAATYLVLHDGGGPQPACQSTMTIDQCR